ncbi:response regulator [Rhodopila sp.]|uniref:response regulator n=1 Tax=Rhodopila sp. TaxID=2480087 RepID=UPI003D0D51F7
MDIIMSYTSTISDSMSAYTVLVVEDDMMVRMPIAEYLRDCGYNVLEAGDASEAIAVLDATVPVSLVFSDVRMPGSMDGFGLARWLRSHHPDIPVILTSGYNNSRSLSQDLAQGVRLIEKPYLQGHVARRIRDLLDN